MKLTSQRKSGLSLIEVLVALVLVGLLVSVSGLLLSPLVQTFLNAHKASELMHQSQLAMARMSREFITITNVVSGSSSAITYDTLDSSGGGLRRTISWDGTAGSPLLLNANTLAGDVKLFTLSYVDGVGETPQSSWGADSTIIEVLLDMGAAGSIYTNRFYPRNLR
jgi:prepilin-type N-terminal cleavage/methylation domain-containing protein